MCIVHSFHLESICGCGVQGGGGDLWSVRRKWRGLSVFLNSAFYRHITSGWMGQVARVPRFDKIGRFSVKINNIHCKK